MEDLKNEQKPFVEADTVDSTGKVWATVGENIRNGVQSGGINDVYNRMPDLDAVSEFWSKLTGLECHTIVVNVIIKNGKIINAEPLNVIDNNTVITVPGYLLWYYFLNHGFSANFFYYNSSNATGVRMTPLYGEHSGTLKSVFVYAS